jgi:hypothetical protein
MEGAIRSFHPAYELLSTMPIEFQILAGERLADQA